MTHETKLTQQLAEQRVEIERLIQISKGEAISHFLEQGYVVLTQERYDHQQAEVERLKSANETLHATIHGMQDGAVVRDQMALIERLKAEVDVTIRSHQKQNAIVARFESMFCDKHLDAEYTNQDQPCAQCLAERLKTAQVLKTFCDEDFVALQAENERLQRLAVHCPDCGADYAETGIEAGCPCKLRAEVERLQCQWQPIETAPMDDTRILVNFGKCGVHAVSWTEPDNCNWKTWCIDDGKFGPYPLRRWTESDVAHWMPLPDPPKEV